VPLHPSRTLQPVPAQPSASILRRTHQPQHQIHLKSNTKRYLNNSNNSPRAHHHRPLHRQLPRRSRQARTIHLTWPTVPSSGSKLRTLRHPRYRMPTNLLQNDLNENEGERREEDNPAALYSFFSHLISLSALLLSSCSLCASVYPSDLRCIDVPYLHYILLGSLGDDLFYHPVIYHWSCVSCIAPTQISRKDEISPSYSLGTKTFNRA
jgi:hypothetical protein